MNENCRCSCGQQPQTFVPVRFPDGRLAFRWDPGRGLVEIVRRGDRYLFDLRIL